MSQQTITQVILRVLFWCALLPCSLHGQLPRTAVPLERLEPEWRAERHAEKVALAASRAAAAPKKAQASAPFRESKMRREDPFLDPFANPIDDPALPRVLIIGDSISTGYTTGVRKLLSGKANVHRVKGNCRYSAFGVGHIDTWLGEGDWNLIHFNFGLWDWYRWSQEPKATPQSYQANLDQIVTRLKATQAKLIFGVTTPSCAGHETKVESEKRSRSESEFGRLI